MYPHPFEYVRTDSVADTIDVLVDRGGDGTQVELLAGGHSLLPTMKSGLATPDLVVDIGGLDELVGIHYDEVEDAVRVGALTTYVTIESSEVVRRHSPVVAAATAAIGDVQVRNVGTIGGNLAHADPAADLPAAVLAADATIVAHGPDGERRIPIDDFFVGMYATTLAPDELVTAVEVPSQASSAAAYVKKPSPSSGYALIGVAAVLDVADGRIERARVAANGALDHGVRLAAVEDALVDGPVTREAIEDAAQQAGDELDSYLFMEDLNASASFREELLTVYTERALERILEDVN